MGPNSPRPDLALRCPSSETWRIHSRPGLSLCVYHTGECWSLVETLGRLKTTWKVPPQAWLSPAALQISAEWKAPDQGVCLSRGELCGADFRNHAVNALTCSLPSMPELGASPHSRWAGALSVEELARAGSWQT